ncbi:MAG: DNA polymerase I [Solobacterium sp.]|jgi:DNA polymerase-1|nr:DNA polymerase I [Solobacterium sp.]MCH4265056.1 DNA polymerase I [Solobacterium sp.]
MKKLLLVDGNSMLFRAYYATAYGAKMTTRDGIPTNAVFAFANMMQKAIDAVQPDAMLVAFDAGKHTFRHDLYADYKGTRKPAPDDLVPQFGMARDYLDGFHIKWVEMPDIEADDLIGSMSKENPDYMTTILTSDHDMLQLIDDTTRVLLMRKGISDMSEMTPASLKEEMGIEPLQIIDLKGLMGDTSDNIPGIKGIGEKTALKLLADYGTVENVLAHDSELKGALQKKVQSGHESAMLSKTLATIKRDVPLNFNAEDCMFQPDYASLIHFFETVGMNSLIKRYTPMLSAQPAKESAEPAPAAVKPAPVVPEAILSVIPPLTKEHTESRRVVKCPATVYHGAIAVYLDQSDDNFARAEVYGIGISNGTDSTYLMLEDLKKDEALLKRLSLPDPIIGFDIKRNAHLLKRAGVAIAFSDDAMITASLSDSSLTSTDKINAAYALETSLSREDVYGKPSKPKMPLLDEQAVYSCEMADNIMTVYQASIKKINEYHMTSLYQDIELPLSAILCNMEDTGILCSAKILSSIAADMKGQIDAEQAEIYHLAGHEFNINSPKQLGEVLYDDLQLPTGKKRSTSADVLEQFIGVHPIIEHLLVYRKLQKLYSTYAEGLQKYISKDGRIHTIYNQCATSTGRLSSSEPNLQNISVRDEQGKTIRKAFLPDEGCVLISSDYHQIELRMLASMADEDHMIAAFQSGIDIHTRTAMDVFGVSEDEVTPLMRRRAKTVNFGIVYGISDFGLAQQLGVTRKEAGDFIAKYYETYPKIRTYMDSLVSFCEEHGYVETLLGRRRDIPEIHDKSHTVREFGKRAAMNAPIQGSAADLIKIAMIHIDQAMKTAGVRSKMILQVHDELIFNVPKEEVEQMKQLINDGMVHAMSLKVPLTAETSVGTDWYEAK